MTNAIFVEKSTNHKLGGTWRKNEPRMCTTYTSIKATCPQSCVLYKTGECYAMLGYVGFITRRLDDGVGPRDSYYVALQEAKAIDQSFRGGMIRQDGMKGGRDLRLHTAGDCKTNIAAKIIAGAIDRWKERGGGDVWTYTHAWKKVHRECWGGVSVLASIDKVEDAVMAVNAGYAPARYVARLQNGAKPWKEKGITWIPCKAQTKDSSCAFCRICMGADKLLDKKMGVVFAAHGCKEGQMVARLEG